MTVRLCTTPARGATVVCRTTCASAAGLAIMAMTDRNRVTLPAKAALTLTPCFVRDWGLKNRGMIGLLGWEA
jgi:hypothetical protein